MRRQAAGLAATAGVPGAVSNFIHHQVTEKNKQKRIYNKHQNTIGTLDYQAVTHV